MQDGFSIEDAATKAARIADDIRVAKEQEKFAKQREQDRKLEESEASKNNNKPSKSDIQADLNTIQSYSEGKLLVQTNPYQTRNWTPKQIEETYARVKNSGFFEEELKGITREYETKLKLQKKSLKTRSRESGGHSY